MEGFKGGKKIGMAVRTTATFTCLVRPAADRQPPTLYLQHLRDLVLHLVAGTKEPNWMFTAHRTSLRSVVVVFLPGVTPGLLNLPTPPPSTNMPIALPYSKETRLPIIHQLFTHAALVRAPGDSKRMHSALGTFMSCPLDAKEKERRDRERASGAQKKAADGERTDVRTYVVTRQDMEDHDYPLPLLTHPELEVGGEVVEDAGEVISRDAPRPPKEDATADTQASERAATYKETYGSKTGTESGLDWVEIASLSPATLRRPVKVFAIDCEMVQTTNGQELARVSVVDWDSKKKIFDELVKPSGEVTDYLTRWSGMTAVKLANATHTLPSIQSYFLGLLSAAPGVLLGHSLESDLRALHLRHPYCIDTSLLYPHPRGPPMKSGLKYLAKQWLGREIQSGEGGHDSEEDARAAGDLLELKCTHGTSLCRQVGPFCHRAAGLYSTPSLCSLGPEFGDPAKENEPLFSKVARSFAHEQNADKQQRTALFDRGNPKRYLNRTTKVDTLADCGTDQEVRPHRDDWPAILKRLLT
jgi:RNA exonuclease 1